MITLLEILKKRLVIAIPIIMIAGFAFGVAVDARPLKQFVLPLTFLMVYPMMVNLQLKKIFQKGDVKVQIVTQVLNFIFIPLLAFGMYKIAFPHSPYIGLGLLLAALLPTSGMTISWTGMAKGNMPAAVKMTVFGLILGSILTPLYIKVLMGTVVDIPMLNIFRQIIIVVVVPLVLGTLTRNLLIKKYGQAKYQKDIKRIFPSLSILGVLGVVFVAMALKAPSIAKNPGQLLGYLVPLAVLYFANFVLSTLAGKLLFNRADAIALVYGTVMRNLSLALAIAMVCFKEKGSQISLIIALAYIIQVQSAAWYVKFTNRIFGPTDEMDAGQIAIKGVFSLHLSDTLGSGIKLLAEEGIHSFAVLDDKDKPVGMVSSGMLIEALADETPYETPLWSLNLEPAVLLSAHQPLKDVLNNMKRQHEYKAIILDDKGNIDSVVTLQELLASMV